MTSRIVVKARITRDFYEYLLENRHNHLYPSSLTEWVQERHQEHKMWVSNRDIHLKIQTLMNRTDLLMKRLDLLEFKVLSLAEKLKK